MKTTDSIPRLTYKLAEAEKITGLTVNQIIQHGVQKDVRLLIDVPEDIIVFSIHPYMLKAEDPRADLLQKKLNQDRGFHFPATLGEPITGFYLSPENCKDIALRGTINLSVFSNNAVHITRHTLKLNIHPITKHYTDFSGDSPKSPYRPVFATYAFRNQNELPTVNSLGKRSAIEITQESLLITASDIEKIISASLSSQTSCLIQAPFIPHVNISKKLLLIIRIGREYLEKSLATNINSENLEKEISYCLSQNGIKNRVLLERILEIIKPLGLRQSPTNADTSSYHITPEIQALINASRKYWLKADIDDPSTYFKRDVIINSLRQDEKLKSGLCEAGATIIRPENAKKGRPAQKPKE